MHNCDPPPLPNVTNTAVIVRILTFSSWRAPPSKSCPGGRWGYTADQPEWPSESCSYANGSTCSQPEEEGKRRRGNEAFVRVHAYGPCDHAGSCEHAVNHVTNQVDHMTMHVDYVSRGVWPPPFASGFMDTAIVFIKPSHGLESGNILSPCWATSFNHNALHSSWWSHNDCMSGQLDSKLLYQSVR